MENFFKDAASHPVMLAELEQAVTNAMMEVAKHHGYDLNKAELEEKYSSSKKNVGCVTVMTIVCTA